MVVFWEQLQIFENSMQMQAIYAIDSGKISDNFRKKTIFIKDFCPFIWVSKSSIILLRSAVIDFSYSSLITRIYQLYDIMGSNYILPRVLESF